MRNYFISFIKIILILGFLIYLTLPMYQTNVASVQTSEINNDITKKIRLDDVSKNPWPMFRYDEKHTAHSPYSGPSRPNISWTYDVNKGVVSSAAISKDSIIYVGTGWNVSDSNTGSLYALTNEGELKWKLDVEGGFFSSPALGENNMIYITSLDGSLYAIKDESSFPTIVLKKPLGFFFNLCSPLISSDGIIHVGSPSFFYYQLYTNGSIRYNYETNWCIISSPARDSNGTVYIGSKDHYLYAFTTNPPGLKWKFPTGTFYDGHLVDSSPAIGPDGTIYFGTDPYGAYDQDPVMVYDNFWAVNPNGTLKWKFETEDGVESSPAIGPEGIIYFGSYDGYLYALKDKGYTAELLWKFHTGGAIDGSPIVDGNGIIYVGSRDGNLYSLYPNGTLQWVLETNGGFESSPSLDDNGYLYIGNFDNTFYCIGTGKNDIGVSSIEIPNHVVPGKICIPKTTIRNYRSNDVHVTVSYIIKQRNTILYEDNVSTDLANAEIKKISFDQWIINADENKNLTVIVQINHSEDENLINNQKTKTIYSSRNHNPTTPTINGVKRGKINANYSFQLVASDSDDDDISYIINWGEMDELAQTDFFNSNEIISISHTWESIGRYIISVKTVDRWGAESDWETLPVIMSAKNPYMSLFKENNVNFFKFLFSRL